MHPPRRILTLLVAPLLISFALGSAARADDATKTKAKEVVTSILPKKQYEKMVQLMVDQMAPALKVSADKLAKAMFELMPYDWLMDVTSDMYAKRFTVDELDAVDKFYKTPAGRKLAAALPEITAESQVVVQKRLQDKLPDLIQKLK